MCIKSILIIVQNSDSWCEFNLDMLQRLKFHSGGRTMMGLCIEDDYESTVLMIIQVVGKCPDNVRNIVLSRSCNHWHDYKMYA